MKRPVIQWAPLTALTLALASCTGGNDASTGHDESAAPPTNRIYIPATVRSNLGISFAAVERRKVAETLRVPGSFELKPLASREYRLILPSQVRLEIDHLDAVEPGTLLYSFQSPDWLELRSRIDQAVAAYEQASRKYESLAGRLDALGKAEFKRADLETEATVLDADRAGRKAELDAALSTASTILNTHRAPGEPDPVPDDLLAPVDFGGRTVPRYQSIGWIEVRATTAGVVQSLGITDGSFGEATTRVLTTVDPAQIRFRALGLQSDLATLAKAEEARIVPRQGNGSDLNDSVPADLMLGLDADPAHRTVTLFADPLEQRPWARPGVSAFLEVVAASTGGPALAIPRSAVVKDGITHVFFKRDPMDPNKAIRVEADLGIDDGRWIEVKSDVGPNDEVVLEGAYELKLASEQSGATQKGGHFHADGTYHGEH